MMNNDEIWVGIPEVNGSYEISNYGRCRRKMKNGYKLVTVMNNATCQVRLNFNGKNLFRALHLLVAQMFIPIPEHFNKINKKLFIKPLDGNIYNCKADNLIWTDERQNYYLTPPPINDSKAIHQYRLNGDFVRRYNDINEIVETHPLWDKDLIIKSIDEKKAVYKYRFEEEK